MQQYYNKAKLSKYSDVPEKLEFEIVRTDSYNEAKVEKSILLTDMVEELKCCAIQTAVVGTGNGALGNVKLNGLELSVRKIYSDAGVKMDLPKTSNLGEGDLTPRRVQRFFRFAVAKYIETTETLSYLYKKYSDHDEKFKYRIFPGAEHMLEDTLESCYLYETYLRLDFKLKTSISERIYRVLTTRGVVNSEDLDAVKSNFNKIKSEI